MNDKVGTKEILFGRMHGGRNFGYVRAVHNSASDVNNYIEFGQFGGGVLRMDRNAASSAIIVATSSIRTPLIKNTVGGSFIYRNFADTALMTIDNAGNISSRYFNTKRG